VQTDSNLIRIQTSESGLGPSDHASFYLEGIPVLHYFTGQHEDYHKPSDDEYKINYAGMEASLNVITQMIASTNKAGKLVFTKTKDVQPGRKSFKVTMGIMPDYTFGGEGLLIDAVSSGKPAEAAGLQRGDIVTQLGQYKVSSVQDYMQALGNFEKGQTVEVTIIRAGANKTLNVTFQ
jgi:C-terminal processing protease CtpA/Prc